MRAPTWRRTRRQGPHQLFLKHAPSLTNTCSMHNQGLHTVGDDTVSPGVYAFGASHKSGGHHPASQQSTHPSPTTATIARTTSGSNCVPECFSSSATATDWGIALR